MRYLIAAFIACLLVALLACNSKRMLAERKLLETQAEYQSIGETIGYEKGRSDGIKLVSAALKTARPGTNGEPMVDMAAAFEYARTNRAR